MKLTSLELKNFTVYKKVSIDFTQFIDNKILIIGENRDEEGLSSNGAGKSQLFEAICFALSGKTSKQGKILANDVIGPFDNEAQVILELDGNFKLKIIRTKKESGSDLELYVNGEAKHVKGNTEKTQHNLLFYLGVPADHYKNWFEDFMNTYYFSKQIAEVFVSKTSGPTDKFQFISRFLNLRVLDLCKENAKSKYDIVKSSLMNYQNQLTIVNTRLANVGNQEELQQIIDDTEERILKARDENKKYIDSLQAAENKELYQSEINHKLELINNEEVRYKNQVEELKSDYDKLNKELDSLEGFKVQLNLKSEELSVFKVEELFDSQDEIQKERTHLEDLLPGLKEEINQLSNKISTVEGHIKNKQKCPKCSTDLMVINNNIEEFNQDELELLLEKLQHKLKGSTNNYSTIRQEIDTLNVEHEKVEGLLKKYQLLKNETDQLKIRLEQEDKLRERINEIVDRRDKLKESDLTEGYKKDIEELRDEINILYKIEPKHLYLHKIKENEESILSNTKLIERNKYILENVQKEVDDKNDLELKSKELNRQLEELDFITKAFPEIRKARIDDFIPQFEVETNSFMHKLRSTIQVNIDTDRLTKKGTVRDEFPITATDGQGRSRGLETFSDGEKSRISIAIAWALKSLTQKKIYLPFKFTLLDEIADGLDETGIDFLGTLMQGEEQFLVITHFNHFKDKFGSIIKSIKEHGQSNIETIN